MNPLVDCWFGFIKNQSCLISNIPNDIFSLGEFLTAVAIFIAVYQLKNSLWDLRIKIRSNLNRWSIALIVLAAISIIYSVLIDQISISIPLPRNVGFFQFLSFILVSTSIIVFLYGATYKTLFSKDNSKKFFEVLYSAIAKDTGTAVGNVVQVLDENLPLLLKHYNNPHNQDNEYKKDIGNVFNVLLVDPILISFLSSNRIDVLCRILSTLPKINSRFVMGEGFIRGLLEKMVQSHDSHLYHQISQNGLALGFNIYKILFEDGWYVNHGFINSSVLFHPNEENRYSEEYLTVQLKIIEIVMRATVRMEANSPILDRYWVIFASDLGDFSRYIANICTASSPEIDPFVASKAQSLLHKLSFFFSSTWPDIFRSEENAPPIPDSQLKVEYKAENGTYYAKNVLAQFALSTVHFLSGLSYIKNKQDKDAIRFYAITAATRFIWKHPPVGDSNNLFFDYLMFEVKENVERGFYPALTKVALIIYAQPTNDPNRDAFLAYVKEKLLPKFAANEKMADGFLMTTRFLSEHVHFDEKDNKLYWFDAHGNPKEVC